VVAPANSPVVVATTAAEPATAEPDLTGYPLETLMPEGLPTAYPYPAATEASPATTEASPAASGETEAAALIELAKKDLAQRLSVAADQITVVSSTYKDWPDSSLGCPQKGMVYSQVITPGYLIVLEQGQKQYDYHTSLASNVVLCTP
jgi:hypothetical protein